LRKAHHSCRAIRREKKKKKNKPTTPSELMNNVATKELKSISGVRNTQA